MTMWHGLVLIYTSKKAQVWMCEYDIVELLSRGRITPTLVVGVGAVVGVGWGKEIQVKRQVCQKTNWAIWGLAVKEYFSIPQAHYRSVAKQILTDEAICLHL